MRRFFENAKVNVYSTFFIGFLAFYFFSSLLIHSVNQLFGDIDDIYSKKTVYLGKISDNLYLTSDYALQGDIFIKVRYVDNKESDFLKIGDSGTVDTSAGFTSELITFDEYIDKVEIYTSEPEKISIGKLNDGIYALFRFDEVVLGLTSEREKSEMLFLEKNKLKVVAREEWDDFDRDLIDQDAEYTDIKNIYVYPVEHLNPGSDLEKIRALGHFQKIRCKDTPGVAPISCTEDEIWGDLSYNYIMASNGVVYQGKVGGNGVSGNHLEESDESISVGLIADNDGNYQQLENISKLIRSLAEVNSVEINDNNIVFVNSLDSENFDLVAESYFSGGQVLPPETEELLGKKKKLLDTDEVVKYGDKVQLLVDKNSSASTKKVVARVSDDLLTETETDYESVLVEESLVDQVVTEALLIDGDLSVQPNFVYRLESWDNSDPNRSIPSDYNQTTHWYFYKTKLPEAWSDMGGCVSDNSCGGDQSVKVAILDTGVAYEDYDFDAGGSYTTELFDPFYVEVPGSDTANGIYNEGYDRQYRATSELSNINFTDPFDSWQYYSCNSLRLSGTDPDPCNAVELAKIDHANDDHGHGTFVTGIVAANTSDAAPNRVIGSAHNVSIIPVKVFTPNDTSMCFDEFGYQDPTCSYYYGDYRSVAFTTTIVEGIDHSVANGAKVINMSLGGPGTDTLVESAIDDAYQAGTFVIVSSGNSNDDTEFYFPANAPSAFTVGATDPTDNRANYSNYGGELDLVAPVGDSSSAKVVSMRYTCSVDSTCSDETDPNLFQSFTSTTSPNQGIGTSYASPQVAAAAAMIWSARPTATVEDVEYMLITSAVDLGATGFDEFFGYGLLNFAGALRNANIWYDNASLQKGYWDPSDDTFSKNSSYLQLQLGDYSD